MSLTDLAVPLIKVLPAEAAHSATIKALKLGLGLPRIDPTQWGTPTALHHSDLDLANPVGLAAGFDKNAEVYSQMARFGFGFIECGTVTPRPQPGNDKPRVFRLKEDEAIINRLGFNNQGLDPFVRRLRHTSSGRPCPVGANIGANKTSTDFIADYEAGIAAVSPHADYITINISSPNTPGLRALQGKTALEELLSRCQAAQEQVAGDGAAKPVFLKIAPDLDMAELDSLVSTIRRFRDWVNGVIVCNTTLERPDTLRSAHRNQVGGLSGAPLRDRANRVLGFMAVHLHGEFDLIGCGGVSSGADALAKIMSGAHAVQLYSALTYHGPGLVAQINADLAARLKAEGFRSVREAVGAGLS